MSQQYKLKQTKLWRRETEWSHSYWTDELGYIVGATTVLDEGLPKPKSLIEWWQRQTKDEIDDVLADATDGGSNVHKVAEQLMQGIEIDLTQYKRKREKDGILAFVDWFRTYKPTELVLERVVYYLDPEDNTFRFAGTMDLVCTINGERWLIDFKTSKAVQLSHKLQVVAYKKAVEQSYDEKIDKLGVLYLGTAHKGRKKKDEVMQLTGKQWKLEPVSEDEVGFEDFKRVFDMMIFINGGKYPEPPTVVEYPDKISLFEKAPEDTVM